MTLQRPRAVIRGGCCGHPETCDDLDCRHRQRWAEERYDAEIEELNKLDVDHVDEEAARGR